eukprot:evm.model.scf_1621.2 EVM.evm.TU.scf_1621.2   scf_1621:21107-25702(-)
MCSDLLSKDDCLDVAECLWYESDESDEPSECGSDFIADIADCLEPQYVAFIRVALCSSLPGKSRCLALPGCQWNETDALCQEDPEALAAVFGLAFFSALTQESQTCEQVSPCVPPCEEGDSGDCEPGLTLDSSSWISPNATSTLCQLMEMSFKCDAMPADSTCKGACEIDGEGECALPEKEAVKFLFGSSKALKKKWLKASKACSAIEGPDECRSFTGGK